MRGARRTRSLACEIKKHTRVVTTGTPETPGIHARNGFNGLLRALPGDRAVLSPSSAELVCQPGRADLPPLDLTPASRRQDHTTSPSATSVVRQRAVDRSRVLRPALPSRRTPNAAASTASRPASVTIAI